MITVKSLIPILLAVALIGCSSTGYKEGVQTILVNISSALSQISGDVGLLIEDPGLRTNKDHFQAMMNHCDVLINVAGKIASLKPPKSLEAYHLKALEMAGEMKALGEAAKLFLGKSDDANTDELVRHLDRAYLLLSEMTKEKTK